MTATEPLYVNEVEAAKLLRHNISWFRSNANVLEQQFGFPKIDVATGMRHKGSIQKWAEERNSRNIARPDGLSETNRGNDDGF